MITRLGKGGTASSHDDDIDLLPRSATGSFEGTGVDMAADLASRRNCGRNLAINKSAIHQFQKTVLWGSRLEQQ